MEFLFHILADVIAAIISGIVLYLWQQLRYIRNLKNKFHNRKFEVKYKGHDQIIRTVLCTVEKNVIKYAGYQIETVKNESAFEGEFILDPINLKIGKGFQIHDYYDGFNFPRLVIRDDNTFYVETFYLSNKDEPANNKHIFKKYNQAYIWNRIPE